MKSQVSSRFENNLDRVKQLVGIYQERAKNRSGRRSVRDEDVLRAATVFLHATLEDLVRSIEEWRLPLADASTLASVPLFGLGQRTDKFSLAELAEHRGKTVQNLIQESVASHLAMKSYGDAKQIACALKRIGVASEIFKPYMANLAELIHRRHNIVHRADRLDKKGKGYHGASAISTGAVNRWLRTVDEFGHSVLRAL